MFILIPFPISNYGDRIVQSTISALARVPKHQPTPNLSPTQKENLKKRQVILDLTSQSEQESEP